MAEVTSSLCLSYLAPGAALAQVSSRAKRCARSPGPMQNSYMFRLPAQAINPASRP